MSSLIERWSAGCRYLAVLHPPLFVWFYNRTGYSVLLVAIFPASFDRAINQLSYDVIPASNTARFLIFSAVILLPAATVIIATKVGSGEPSRPL